jgi:protein TonB
MAWDDGMTTSNPAVTNPDPPEGVFVAFDEPPVPIVHPDPIYPDWARENGIEGRIILHALIGADGRVRRITVIRGIPGLSESAAEALRHWTFRPATSNRQAVAVWIEVPFLFRL